MKKAHDEIASKSRDLNYNKFWFNNALELLRAQRVDPKNVLDVGAGKGEFLEILKNRFSINKLVGIDYIDSDIDILKGKGIQPIKINLDNFEVSEYPQLKESFDLVVCLETIEHVFNTDKLFQFFYYALKENSYLVLSTPNSGALFYKLFYLIRGYPFGENHHVRFFSYSKLRQYSFFNGFDVIMWNNFFEISLDFVKRTFGLRQSILVKILAGLLYGPFFLLNKLGIHNNSACSNFVVLLKKNSLPPLGLEIDNFRKNFFVLSEQQKSQWIERIKQYYKKDHLGEHIYFKAYIEELIGK